MNLEETELSSSTESTNAIPFANENIGTIKQRSPTNPLSSFEPSKRSLPHEFFNQQTAPIYDNNQGFIRKNTTNVLSDIDTMLSDLNRELDQMLDYEKTNLSDFDKGKN